MYDRKKVGLTLAKRIRGRSVYRRGVIHNMTALEHLASVFPGYGVRAQVPGAELAGLGFSLKPPEWLRNIVGSVVKGTIVSVPTPAGPLQFDLSDPNALKVLQDMARNATVTTRVSNRPATDPFAQVNESVQQIPGGWLTIAALAVGGFMLLRRR